GLGALGAPGGGALGIEPGLLPNETILSTRGQRLVNSTLAELDFFTSPRSSFTLVGGYAYMHHVDDDTLDFGNAIFQAGYNYQVSRADTIALIYILDNYQFVNAAEAINGNAIQI